MHNFYFGNFYWTSRPEGGPDRSWFPLEMGNKSYEVTSKDLMDDVEDPWSLTIIPIWTDL